MRTKLTVKLYNAGAGKVTALLLGELPKGSSISDGMRGELSWRDGRSVRRLTQQGLYWLLNEFLQQYLSQDDPAITAEEIHGINKNMFLPRLAVIAGKAFKSTKSTTVLSVSEFSEFMEKVINYWGSLGIPVELFQAQYEEELKRRGMR